MPDYQFTTVSQSIAGSAAQWDGFARDPFGDGRVAWIEDVPDVENKITLTAPVEGVAINRHVDHDDRIIYYVHLTGPRENDDVSSQFRTLGAAASLPVSRKETVYTNGVPTGRRNIASGVLTTRQWRNIILITGVGSEVSSGKPTKWPDNLLHVRWA